MFSISVSLVVVLNQRFLVKTKPFRNGPRTHALSLLRWPVLLAPPHLCAVRLVCHDRTTIVENVDYHRHSQAKHEIVFYHDQARKIVIASMACSWLVILFHFAEGSRIWANFGVVLIEIVDLRCTEAARSTAFDVRWSRVVVPRSLFS